jgi:hypothetical protein
MMNEFGRRMCRCSDRDNGPAKTERHPAKGKFTEYQTQCKNCSLTRAARMGKKGEKRRRGISAAIVLIKSQRLGVEK